MVATSNPALQHLEFLRELQASQSSNNYRYIFVDESFDWKIINDLSDDELDLIGYYNQGSCLLFRVDNSGCIQVPEVESVDGNWDGVTWAYRDRPISYRL